MDTLSKGILSKNSGLISLKNRGGTKSSKNDIPPSMDITDDSSVQLNSQNSQNFTLRLSDSLHIEDASENSTNLDGHRKESPPDIIEISDSSDDECLRAFSKNKNNQMPSSAWIPRNQSPISISSRDSIEVLSDDEQKTPDQLTRLKSVNNDSLLTSDESSLSIINSYHKTNDANDGLSTSPGVVLSRQQQTDDGHSRSNQNREISASTHLHTPLKEFSEPRHAIKLSTRTTPLTKKDTRNIIKALKSQRAVHTITPSNPKNDQTILDSDSNCSTKISKTNSERKKIKHPAWIPETESEDGDSGTDDDDRSRLALRDNINEAEIATSLSDRKKQDIARWLMTNPSDAQSDTSMSIVTASEANSFNSGNSSLERLEELYETPNNRDKYRPKLYPTPEPKKISTPTRLVETVRAPKTSIPSNINSVNTKCHTQPVKSKKSTTITSKKRYNIQITDCADVLDELYGSSWRNKADILLPKTNSKKNYVNNREESDKNRKITNLSDFCSQNQSDFNSIMKNTPKTSTVKRLKKPQYPKMYDSFINDDSSDNDEGTFVTALTTPMDPKKNVRKTPPMSAAARRVIEICDSDTDDDGHTRVKKVLDTRKRLSFSDEVGSSTDTSEYDPTDVIPPKSVTKSGNTIARNRNFVCTSRYKSFLASLSPCVPLEITHPDAKIYRLNFQNNKVNLCQRLFKLFNEKIFGGKLPGDMSIEWNVRMSRTAGYCYNKKKKTTLGGVERSSRIVLATKILDTADRVRDTLIHEMCHAATWIINEISDGHGPFWKTWASKSIAVFPELPRIGRCHDYKIATKFTYRCVSCGYSIGRHSKSLDIVRKRCGHCFGKFELLVNRKTKAGVVQVKASNSRQPSAFALFVKNHYQSVKKEHSTNGHKEALNWDLMLID